MPQPKKEEAKVEDIKTITLPERLTIKELADKMKLQPSVIVKKLPIGHAGSLLQASASPHTGNSV